MSSDSSERRRGESHELTELMGQVRLIREAVLAGEPSPIWGWRTHRLGCQRWRAGLTGQQLRSDPHVSLEPPLELTDTDVDLFGQRVHAYPAAPRVDQPDCLAYLRPGFAGRFKLGKQQIG
jgi:hypothetical protein